MALGACVEGIVREVREKSELRGELKVREERAGMEREMARRAAMVSGCSEQLSRQQSLMLLVQRKRVAGERDEAEEEEKNKSLLADCS